MSHPSPVTNLTTSLGLKPRSAWLVVAITWSIVVFDGYDLIVYGTTVPALMHAFNLTPPEAGFMGSLAFLGMVIGATGAGVMADRLGRRRSILLSTTVFSVFTIACGLAADKYTFGLFRVLAGIGLGGLVPSANALTAEFVSRAKRSIVSTIMMSGVPVGGTLAAFIAIPVLRSYDWKWMYFIAAVGLVVILPIVHFLLPESAVWLHAHGRTAEALQVARQYGLDLREESEQHGHAENVKPTFTSILRKPYGLASLMFLLSTFAVMFTWYGLATWIPKLMQGDATKYNMGNPLYFLVALNLGAVIGSFVTAWGGVRFGAVRSGVVAALGAAVGLGYLFVVQPHTVAPIYTAFVFAGIGTHGTLCLILAAIASHYPPRLRGTGLGFSFGIGRIGAVIAPYAGGYLVTSSALGGNPVSRNMFAFAGAALTAAVLLLVTEIATKRSSLNSVLAVDASAADLLVH